MFINGNTEMAFGFTTKFLMDREFLKILDELTG